MELQNHLQHAKKITHKQRSQKNPSKTKESTSHLAMESWNLLTEFFEIELHQIIQFQLY